jgi:hypothetical protein
MSDPLRLALVAEGPTHRIVIDAAISRILRERPFIHIQLFPEGSLAFGPLGAGWGGVYKWCKRAVERDGKLSNDPLFDSYDLLILHLDADVADKTYNSANIQDHSGDLPCAHPCPPPRATTDRLRRVLLRWVGEITPPDRIVLCTPSKATEAWVLAALFPNDPAVLGGNLECLQRPENRFGQQPIESRIYDYASHTNSLREAWPTVTEICTEAQRFSDDFRRALQTVDAIANGTDCSQLNGLLPLD